MFYNIRTVEIPLVSGELIEFKASTLCKIVEVIPTGHFFIDDITKPLEERRLGADVVVLERWGQTKGPDKNHKIVILKYNQQWEYTMPFEPVLSRRGSFVFQNEKHFVFQV